MSFVLITRGTLDAEKITETMMELQSSSDRAAAIIGGSIVEMCLVDALKAHMHRNENITDELFRSTGALGAFATKIHMGFLTGIYGEAAHRELLIIKDIRNRFAHSLVVRDFNTDQIKSWTTNLTFGDRYTVNSSKVREKGPLKDAKKIPYGQWPMWFGTSTRDKDIQTSRGRFLLSVGALTYGLSVPLHSAMPKPEF